MSQTRSGFAKVKTPKDAPFAQTHRSKFGATTTQLGFKTSSHNIVMASGNDEGSKKAQLVAPYLAQISAAEAKQQQINSSTNKKASCSNLSSPQKKNRTNKFQKISKV